MPRSHSMRGSSLAGTVMYLPYLILLVGFGVIPVLLTIEASFRPSLANPAGGIANYAVVVQDFRFLPALLNVGLFLLIYVPAMLIVVSLMSLLLDAIRSRWNVALRLAYIVPAAITGSVAILVWYFLLEPSLSPYRDLLSAIGITESSQVWNSGNLVWIFAAIAFSTGAGMWVIIQYGSLQSVPDEVIEAARIDGCNAVQLGLLIKLPLIRKYLAYMGILTFAAGLQVFVEPQLISATVYKGLAQDWSLNQLGYSLAFESGNLGGAAALSLMLLVVCTACAVVVIYRTDFFDGAGVKR